MFSSQTHASFTVKVLLKSDHVHVCQGCVKEINGSKQHSLWLSIDLKKTCLFHYREIFDDYTCYDHIKFIFLKGKIHQVIENQILYWGAQRGGIGIELTTCVGGSQSGGKPCLLWLTLADGWLTVIDAWADQELGRGGAFTFTITKKFWQEEKRKGVGKK